VPFERILRDVDNYEGSYHRAAALLQKIITTHYFEDGNKRTAWVMTRTYLESYGYVPEDTSERAERVLRNIRLFNVNEIAEWLETGEIDKERFPPR
jgi:death-on-curing protein